MILGYRWSMSERLEFLWQEEIPASIRQPWKPVADSLEFSRTAFLEPGEIQRLRWVEFARTRCSGRLREQLIEFLSQDLLDPAIWQLGPELDAVQPADDQWEFHWQYGLKVLVSEEDGVWRMSQIRPRPGSWLDQPIAFWHRWIPTSPGWRSRILLACTRWSLRIAAGASKPAADSVPSSAQDCGSELAALCNSWFALLRAFAADTEVMTAVSTAGLKQEYLEQRALTLAFLPDLELSNLTVESQQQGPSSEVAESIVSADLKVHLPRLGPGPVVFPLILEGGFGGGPEDGQQLGLWKISDIRLNLLGKGGFSLAKGLDELQLFLRSVR